MKTYIKASGGDSLLCSFHISFVFSRDRDSCEKVRELLLTATCEILPQYLFLAPVMLALLIIIYYNVFRKLVLLPRCCNSEGMCAHVVGFTAIMRKRTASVLGSGNRLVRAQFLENWTNLHVYPRANNYKLLFS